MSEPTTFAQAPVRRLARQMYVPAHALRLAFAGPGGETLRRTWEGAHGPVPTDGSPRYVPAEWAIAAWREVEGAAPALTYGALAGKSVRASWFAPIGTSDWRGASVLHGVEEILEGYALGGLVAEVRVGLSVRGFEVGFRPTAELQHKRHVWECTASALVTLIRLWSGRPAVPTEIGFMHDPGEDGRLDDVFGAPVRFQQRSVGLCFPREVATRAVRRDVFPDARSLDGVEVAPDPLLHIVRGFLLTSDDPEAWSLARAAERCRVSARTLQRRLGNAGTTFDTFRDEARYARARRELSGGLSIEEVASRLGFSSHSVFSRSFRRWSGMSPSAFRAAFARVDS